MSGPIDLIIISDLRANETTGGEREKPLPRLLTRNPYWYSIWLVLIVTIFCELIRTFISPTNVLMFYLIGVVVAAISWGSWPAVFTASASVPCFDFFFVPPTLTFRVTDSEYLITFAAFLFVGVVIGLLVARTRDLAYAAQRREDYTATLYALSVDLASAEGIGKILEIVGLHVLRSCHCRSAFLIPQEGVLKLAYASGDLKLDEKEMTAANWTFNTGVVAGKDTETLSSASIKYFPLRTAKQVVGVMGVQPEEQEAIVKMEQERLLRAFASQAAVALERGQLWDQLCMVEKPTS